MKFLLLAAAAVALLTPGLHAAMSDAEGLVALDAFLDNPLEGSPAQVMKFADESPDHLCKLAPKYVPWMQETNPPAGHELLLAAFVACDLKAQITRKSTTPQPYAGVLAVIEVYKKIKAHKPSFQSPGVENFIALEKQGKLKQYIEE